MSTRRSFLVAAALGMSVLAGHPHARIGNKPKRVGIVYPEPPSSADALRGWAAFDQEMRDLGWIAGHSIVFERRYFYGDRARLQDLMAELVALDVDLLYVQGVFAVSAARQASDRIPIVFAVGDAVGRGVVANLARPEGNATGVSNRGLAMGSKRVELLTQMAPGISRIAALVNTDPGYPAAAFRDLAHRGVEIFIVEFKGARDIAPAMATVAKRRADAITFTQWLEDPFRADLVEAIAKLRLPAVMPDRQYVELGGLLSFERDIAYNFRRIAVFIDKILRGAKPAALPVEEPTAFELAINVKTARTLGLTIPRDLLVRADWIVE